MKVQYSHGAPLAFDRRRFLKLSATGLAGAVLLGTGAAGTASARTKELSIDKALVSEFEAAANKYDVPVDLLISMGYVNTRWRMPDPADSAYDKGEAEGRGAYGIMSLVQNPTSDTLGAASSITGISEEDLKSDRASNIQGGAAILARALGDDNGSDLADKLGAISGRGRAAGRDFKAVAGVGGGELYAEQVADAIDLSVAKELRSGESIDYQALSMDDTEGYASTYSVRRKPNVVWYPAHGRNYTAANRPRSHRIRYIVIHVTQGSWSSALNWFQNPAAGVSAHYTVRSRDGRIGQSVSDKNIAYHAGNWKYNKHSIGIEHEGYINNPSWFTPEMFRRSAKLTAWLCRRYNIPVNRRRIIGHNEVPGATHTDPGRYWWWRYYMKRVRRFSR